MCGFILYIFIYLSQIFRTANPFLKTQEEKKQTKTKSSIAVYTTKETEKETSTTYCTI